MSNSRIWTDWLLPLSRATLPSLKNIKLKEQYLRRKKLQRGWTTVPLLRFAGPYTIRYSDEISLKSFSQLRPVLWLQFVIWKMIFTKIKNVSEATQSSNEWERIVKISGTCLCLPRKEGTFARRSYNGYSTFNLSKFRINYLLTASLRKIILRYFEGKRFRWSVKEVRRKQWFLGFQEMHSFECKIGNVPTTVTFKVGLFQGIEQYEFISIFPNQLLAVHSNTWWTWEAHLFYSRWNLTTIIRSVFSICFL